jgi:putative transposase
VRPPRGVKVEDCKRGRKFHRVNVVAAQIHDKNGVRQTAALCYHGTMNGIKFEYWFENILLKSIKKGKTIIMDRARFHRKTNLEILCKKAGARLLFLPPYSPDFNPIEKTWANMKRELRSTAPMFDLLETAIYNYLS